MEETFKREIFGEKMGQQEVMKLLLKTKKPLTSKEISKRLGVSWSTGCKTITKLVKENTVSKKVCRTKRKRNPMTVFYSIPKGFKI